MRISYLLILVLFLISTLSADNSLSVREDSKYGRVVDGYMDEIVLVVELNGAYAEQALYIKYSDHGALGHGTWSEITHRFELPEKAAVTDMWLWIGDSVMQADIMEVNKAQNDFDSITAQKIDPALLKVTDKQYDFNIYPLESGNYRKVKVNFMVPVSYDGTKPIIPLPHKFLSADNNSKTRVKVLFRSLINDDAIPQFLEDSTITFENRIDTLGFNYKEALIPNLKEYEQLTLTTPITFSEGNYSRYYIEDSSLYYTFGMYQKDFLGVDLNNGDAGRKIAIGLDMSGNYGMDTTFLMEELPKLINNVTTEADLISLYLSRDSLIDTLPWTTTSQQSLTILKNGIKEGNVWTSLKMKERPSLLLSDALKDGHATQNWNFSNINNLFDVKLGADLLTSCDMLDQYDIVTSYCHGWKGNLGNINAIDSFLISGGTFVLFIDYNRTGDQIAKKYLDGFILPTSADNKGNTKITRNPESELGLCFPETFHHMRANPIRHSDPLAENALNDEYGNPIVVTKKIGAGKLVVTGFWHINDDPSLKETLLTGILGAHSKNNNSNTDYLINTLGQKLETETWDHTILISNSAKLVTQQNISEQMNLITPGVLEKLPSPIIYNILPNDFYTPPMCAINNETYFGSGYLLSQIAEKSGGVYLGAEYNTFDDIISYLAPQFPKLKDLQFSVSPRANVNSEMFQIGSSTTNLNKPIYWIGKTDLANEITFNVSATYVDSVKSNSAKLNCLDSTKESTQLLKTIYYQNILEGLLSAPTLDTAKILAISFENRLLNDFTAFMAYEADSTHFFMKDPHDESKHTPIEKEMNLVSELQVTHTLLSNNQLTMDILSPIVGNLEVSLFNLKGQLIKEIKQGIVSHELQNISLGENYATGMYIVVVRITDPKGVSKPMQLIQRVAVK